MEGDDFDETFAPIARLESICLLMAFACTLKFKLYQMDVKSAFLHEYLHEVFVAQPKGFEDPLHPDHVYRLKNKALYRLKQALRDWYERHTEYLLKGGHMRGEADRTLFIRRGQREVIVIQI